MMQPKTNNWKAIYQQKIESVNYQADDFQLKIIEHFTRIEREMAQLQPKHQNSSFLNQLKNKLFSKKEEQVSIKGVYLHGSVGRGKTFLLDLFCKHSTLKVQRLHYHHFMKTVHDELKQIKDTPNPLDLITHSFAQKYQVLCLDEFMVSDITDAMLLYGLLKGLIEKQVVILITTNIAPDNLYKNGLQRERFIPAIELIKSHLFVHDIGEGLDYRKTCVKHEPRFFSPNNNESHIKIEQLFNRLSEGLSVSKQQSITVNNRKIDYIAKSEEAIWFDFNILCGDFRSQLDYLYLAKKFPVFIVTNIPILDEFLEEEARRFLLLIDELYDKRILLFLSSEKPITEIYKGKRILFEFDRLQSRLFEMQSSLYGEN